MKSQCPCFKSADNRYSRTPLTASHDVNWDKNTQNRVDILVASEYASAKVAVYLQLWWRPSSDFRGLIAKHSDNYSKFCWQFAYRHQGRILHINWEAFQPKPHASSCGFHKELMQTCYRCWHGWQYKLCVCKAKNEFLEGIGHAT